MTAHATCDGCGLVKRLTATGLIAVHYVRVPERVRNTSHWRKTRRACPGSGRAPRPPTGGTA